jgi:hypothetical protein
MGYFFLRSVESRRSVMFSSVRLNG